MDRTLIGSCSEKSEALLSERKTEELFLIDRAKCLLISYLGLSEQTAHRYIGKHAMDMRVTRRMVAEEILKTYEV